MPNLEILELVWCNIGDDGAVALADCRRFERLRELDVEGNWISTRGAMALARTRNLSKLTRLNLSDNTDVNGNDMDGDVLAKLRQQYGKALVL